jgi:hypothetical protein
MTLVSPLTVAGAAQVLHLNSHSIPNVGNSSRVGRMPGAPGDVNIPRDSPDRLTTSSICSTLAASNQCSSPAWTEMGIGCETRAVPATVSGVFASDGHWMKHRNDADPGRRCGTVSREPGDQLIAVVLRPVGVCRESGSPRAATVALRSAENRGGAANSGLPRELKS